MKCKCKCAQLKWIFYAEEEEYYAYLAIVGIYVITTDYYKNDKPFYWAKYKVGRAEFEIGDKFKTLEKAQQACQKEYERIFKDMKV